MLDLVMPADRLLPQMEHALAVLGEEAEGSALLRLAAEPVAAERDGGKELLREVGLAEVGVAGEQRHGAARDAAVDDEVNGDRRLALELADILRLERLDRRRRIEADDIATAVGLHLSPLP